MRVSTESTERPDGDALMSVVLGDGGVVQVSTGLVAGLDSRFYEVEEGVETEGHTQGRYRRVKPKKGTILAKLGQDGETPCDDPERATTFRLKNQRVHLTYAYQFDKRKFLEEMLRRVQGMAALDIKVYSIVWEWGDKGISPHTHAAFEFERPLETVNVRFFDYATDELREEAERASVGISDADERRAKWSEVMKKCHPHIKKVVGLKHWQKVCGEYHWKEHHSGRQLVNPETGEVFEAPVPLNNYGGALSEILADELRAIQTEQELQREMSRRGISLSKYGGFKQAWVDMRREALNVQRSSQTITLKDFQERICREIASPVYSEDDRSVTWVTDHLGGSGKSRLTSHLQEMYPEQVLLITDPKESNAFYLASEHIRAGKTIKIVIFNLTRMMRDYDGFYRMTEAFKDGNFNSGKYVPTHVKFPSPYVIVFSNTGPTVANLSRDRWNIRVIGPDQKTFLVSFLSPRNSALYQRFLEVEREGDSAVAQAGLDPQSPPETSSTLDISFYQPFTEQKIEELSLEAFARGEVLSISREVIPCANEDDHIPCFNKKRRPYPEEVRRGQAVSVVMRYRSFTPEEAERYSARWSGGTLLPPPPTRQAVERHIADRVAKARASQDASL
jgi:hypothetical protein